MLPHTGPYERIERLVFEPPYQAIPKYFYKNVWYRQAKPRTDRLEQHARFGIVDRGSMPNTPLDAESLSGSINATGSAAWLGSDQNLNQAKDRAWGRFAENMNASGELGETLVQQGTAFGMIVKRAAQLEQVFRDLRHGRLNAALATLRLKHNAKDNDVWARDRNVAEQIIELRFGWMPLASDMYEAMHVLTEPVFGKKVRGRGKSEGWRSIPATRTTDPYTTNVNMKVIHRVQYTADIRVTNPNLALLSSLGLTNIFGTIAAVTPWSFVFDWFTNFSQALEGYNRFFGREVHDPITTVMGGANLTQDWNTYGWHQSFSGWQKDRTMGFAIPQFYVRPFKGWSPVRAITAMSLLIMQLPKRSEAYQPFEPVDRRKPRPPRFIWDEFQPKRGPR